MDKVKIVHLSPEHFPEQIINPIRRSYSLPRFCGKGFFCGAVDPLFGAGARRCYSLLWDRS